MADTALRIGAHAARLMPDGGYAADHVAAGHQGTIEETTEDQSRDADPAGDGRAGRRVLVVDDNPDGADSLAEVLRLLGHNAEVAYDGPAAVTKAVNDAFDFVLLDINMPGIDGYEVARRIRAEAPGGPHRFVAMTGFGTEEDHARSRNEGFIAHLVKPVDYDRLIEILENI